MDVVNAIVLVAYAVLGLELRFMSVPSSVSTRQLLRRPRARSFSAKLALVLPIVLINGLFLLPLLVALAPRVIGHLMPIGLPQPGARLLGVLLLIPGCAVTPLSILPLRRALDQGQLATSGIFAWSRNPILMGMYTFYLGNWLIAPTAVTAVGFAFYLAYMHTRVLMEEADLRERCPVQYAEYAARVPRYLGLRPRRAR